MVTHALRLYAVGFPDHFDEASVAGLFLVYGQVPRVQLVRKQGRGPFAFVDVSPVAAALVALEELHHSVVDGNFITVQRARPYGSAVRGLRDLCETLDESELEAVVAFGRELVARRQVAG
jgi:hypothetical protein